MKYDAQVFGNHDVETGHPVYDKWIKELNCPVLGSNIISTSTGEPYVKPYLILNREGVKVAVLGMITPAIPNWLTENLWSGLKFENMVTNARKWVKYLQENEKPDVIIGLFHSGKDGASRLPNMMKTPLSRWQKKCRASTSFSSATTIRATTKP